MSRNLAATLLVCAIGATAGADDSFLDRLGEKLIFSSGDGTSRGRISGTLDLEAYRVQAPAPGLIFTDSDFLFTPRLTLFLDAQVGERVYLFAQARADRGFDPSERHLRGRLDEWAVRFAPFDGASLNVQVGKFATVVGSWVARHGSWENPFVTAPLPYEHLTGIWDSAAAKTSSVLLAWSHVNGPSTAAEEYADKRLRSPIIWGPAYATGVALFAEAGNVSAAVEIKNSAPSISPAGWDPERDLFKSPTVSARLTWQPNMMWRLGFSASSGTYLRPLAVHTLATGYSLGDYRQILLGQEIGFAWHHWQFWAEVFETRFEVPRVGDADAVSGYAEVKYRFTPIFAGALRYNFHHAGTIPHGSARARWGRDAQRIDIAPSWRLSPHVLLKVQASFQHEPGAPREDSTMLSSQITIRF